MKHSLQLKLSQHLTLTPQLQQSIRLLQLSTLELNQELDRFLQENPLLEREEEGVDNFTPALGSSAPEAPAKSEPEPEAQPEPANGTEIASLDDDLGSFGARDDDDESDYPRVATSTPSLREHLLWQINVTNLSER